MFAGAAFISSSSNMNGRIVACEHTKAHWLHWIHFVGSHSGTFTAIPRFSYAEAPVANWPSAQSAKAETGRLSPSINAIGSSKLLTILTVSLRPVYSIPGASASGLDHEAGTSTLWIASTPASIAL